jgi:hypothetical protein
MKKSFLIVLLTGTLITIVAFVDFWGVSTQTAGSKDKVAFSCKPIDYSGKIDLDDNIAVFEGEEFEIPQLALAEDERNVLSLANEERWIEVDLSDQKLYAWEGNDLFLESAVSTGLPGTPTPTGEFRIWIKLRATKMEGGQGRYYYYLPNVPYVMFFENDQVPGWKGYGLHGTYWHSDFGTQRSHGCVNLPTNIAEQLYYWTSPVLGQSKYVVKSSIENQGTRIVIHE